MTKSLSMSLNGAYAKPAAQNGGGTVMPSGGAPMILPMDMVMDPNMGDMVSRATLYQRYGVIDPALVPRTTNLSSFRDESMTNQPVVTGPVNIKGPVGPRVPYKPGSPPPPSVRYKYPVLSQTPQFKVPNGAAPTTAPSQAPTSFILGSPPTAPQPVTPTLSNLPSGLVGSTPPPITTRLASGNYGSLLTSLAPSGPASPAVPGQPTRAEGMLGQIGGGMGILLIAGILFWFVGKGGK